MYWIRRVATLLVVAVCVGAAVVWLMMPSSRARDMSWLEQTYGPHKESQGPEEWIIRDFFQDKRNGTFVDVGAADYKVASNTFFLETQLGWSGIAIDAQEQYRAGYLAYRPRTKFFTFFVADRSNEQARLYLSSNKFWASSSEEFAGRNNPIEGSIEVPTITLDDLLTSLKMNTFDLLSMDIELAEPKALAGFDIDRFKPALVVVESHAEVRPQLVDYFTTHGYVIVRKYLDADTDNLWFEPFPKK